MWAMLHAACTAARFGCARVQLWLLVRYGVGE